MVNMKYDEPGRAQFFQGQPIQYTPYSYVKVYSKIKGSMEKDEISLVLVIVIGVCIVSMIVWIILEQCFYSKPKPRPRRESNAFSTLKGRRKIMHVSSARRWPHAAVSDRSHLRTTIDPQCIEDEYDSDRDSIESEEGEGRFRGRSKTIA